MRVLVFGVLLTVACSSSESGEPNAQAGSPPMAGASGAIGTSGAPAGGAGGGAAGASGAAGSAGLAGADAGGSAGAGEVGGSGGAAVIQPIPFKPAGCPDFTAYRVPPGHFLAITGSFVEVRALTAGCAAPTKPGFSSCSTVTNLENCKDCKEGECPVCMGQDLVPAFQAEPGQSFSAELRTGQGSCVGGVPVNQ